MDTPSKDCTRCEKKLPLTAFARSLRKENARGEIIEYHRLRCRACETAVRNAGKKVGIWRRFSDVEFDAPAASADKFGELETKAFYELCKIAMPYDSFRRYVRLGKIKEVVTNVKEMNDQDARVQAEQQHPPG